MTEEDLGEIRLVLASIHTKLVRIERVVEASSYALSVVFALNVCWSILVMWRLFGAWP